MDLNKVDENIQRLYGEIFQIEKSKQRLIIISHHLNLLYSDLTFHKSKMNKEHQDVLNLDRNIFKQSLNTTRLLMK